MPDYREQEVVNETTFRELNEWAEEANDERRDTDLAVDTQLDVYLCECSDPGCTDPISLTRREYEAVRAVPIRFAIALDHENPEIDRMVREHERFATVEMFHGVGARIALATDPRR